MTRVDECTKADTGVGAAIAAGSHLENGSWALFVIAARRILTPKMFEYGDSHESKMFQCDVLRYQPILINKRTSPIRLVRAVIMPAAKDLGFW